MLFLTFGLFTCSECNGSIFVLNPSLFFFCYFVVLTGGDSDI